MQVTSQTASADVGMASFGAGASARAPRSALVLLSGGLDSAVTAAAARRLGFAIHAISFEYGQRHAVELGYAERLARDLGCLSHRRLTLAGFDAGASALTDAGAVVPRGRDLPELESAPIPVTYVPARNTIFLAHAIGCAEQLDLTDIFLGVNSLDYSGYPDCRPEYLLAAARLAALATRAGVEAGRPIRLRAPLLHRTKAEIIRLGVELGVDPAKTWSCYDPQPISTAPGAPDGPDTPGAPAEAVACGVCDSCVLRRRGFEAAGVPDPTPYRA